MTVAEVQQPLIQTPQLLAHVGDWVALRDGQVVAAAAGLADLERDERVHPDDTLVLVPDPSAHFFRNRRG